MQRRKAIAAALTVLPASAVLSAPNVITERTVAPKAVKPHAYPKPPSDWYGEGMYTDLLEKGMGIKSPSECTSPNRRKLLLTFDTQCPWCHRLHEALKPLYPFVTVIWYPVATLGIHSEPQGSAMLASVNPWKAFLAHMNGFRSDIKPRGKTLTQSEIERLPMKVREAVWTNSKIHRRTACRTVPFGVYRNTRGEYVPVWSGMKTDELAQLLEVSDMLKK